MIALLQGQPIIQGQKLIILVNGVGYDVAVGTRLLATIASQLNQGQNQVTVQIYTHVREDALELFGFETAQDKELFELLLNVSGVGPKTALAIMDVGASSIIKAVQAADVKTFSSAPRVGTKLAQKIIIELKPKLGSLNELYLGPTKPQEQDVLDALLALGYSEQQAHQTLQQLEITDTSETAALIKKAIKLLS